MVLEKDVKVTSKKADAGNYLATIKVVGVGGGGVNAVNRMADYGLEGVELIALNTDAQQLLLSDADIKLDIGRDLTNGLGAGGSPEVGRNAAQESAEEIKEILKGADMVFITTGEGGGTGTGASPVVARIAKELGCLTVGVVTKPFGFEGRKKMQKATDGIEELKKYVDSIIVIPNERLRHLGDKKLTISNAFSLVDDVLLNSVRAITDIIVKIEFLSIDFADIDRVMRDSGTTIIGIGEAEGEDRIIRATQQAISSPLLENRIDNSTGIIFCTFASEDSLELEKFGQAATLLEESSDPDAEIKAGFAFDDTLGEKARVIVIATGFNEVTAESQNDGMPYDFNSPKIDAETIQPLGDPSLDTNSSSDLYSPVDTKIPTESNFDTADFMPNFAQNSTIFSSDVNPTVGPQSGSISSISGVTIPQISPDSLPQIDQEDGQVDSLELPSFLND
jgi:cell division protein FtsZ